MSKIAEVETELLKHEAVCAERYEMIIFRIERLEKIMIIAAGAMIVGLTSILSAILLGQENNMPGYKMKDKKKKVMSYKSGGKVFKNCATCKSKAACKKAGKCLKKAK